MRRTNHRRSAYLRRILIGLTLAAALVPVGLPTAAAEDQDRTHVVISGPRQDWDPRPRLLLETGHEEWVVSGSLGVRAVTDLPTTVIIRDLSDCRTLFSFAARPRGSDDGYWVTVDAGRRFTVRPTTGLSEAARNPPSPGNRCPDLPDTSTAGRPIATPSDLLAALHDRLLSAIDRLL